MRMLVAVSLLTLLGAEAAAQSNDSQSRATELATRLGAGGTSSFAAVDPDDPTRFVAVLHIPKVQLLLIAGRYQSPALLRELILKGDHQRVYLDLNSAADREGRFFVEDLGANGLRPDRDPNTPFDITWRDGALRTLYNGGWKDQKLSEQEYRQRFSTDANDYAAALKVLLDAHRAETAASSGVRR